MYKKFSNKDLFIFLKCATICTCNDKKGIKFYSIIKKVLNSIQR